MLKIHSEIYQVLYVKKQKNTIFVPSSNLGNSIYQQRELCKNMCGFTHPQPRPFACVLKKTWGHLRFFLWRVCFAVVTKKHIHQPGFVWHIHSPHLSSDLSTLYASHKNMATNKLHNKKNNRTTLDIHELLPPVDLT